jgi:hypothetical protein
MVKGEKMKQKLTKDMKLFHNIEKRLRVKVFKENHLTENDLSAVRVFLSKTFSEKELNGLKRISVPYTWNIKLHQAYNDLAAYLINDPEDYFYNIEFIEKEKVIKLLKRVFILKSLIRKDMNSDYDWLRERITSIVKKSLTIELENKQLLFKSKKILLEFSIKDSIVILKENDITYYKQIDILDLDLFPNVKELIKTK